MRDAKRLTEIRKLPCVECGKSPVDVAHSNFSEHGKGKGIKADDRYTIPLCRNCHMQFDLYVNKNRDESKVWFLKHLETTDRMLSASDEECF
ncbi:hypothetical protein SKM57_11190 [Acinetobacter faecalis]|uniref:DUF968 domain-containing protein n=1 Tax=Acinetobacter faecalis TaxID=2665161 RepID=UPI002A91071B|nr:hypothetical protein [Acinetobacter faecalis]MDY6469144.1 hypothetical protein [Acinetobacter faecalis]